MGAVGLAEHAAAGNRGVHFFQVPGITRRVEDFQVRQKLDRSLGQFEAVYASAQNDIREEQIGGWLARQ